MSLFNIHRAAEANKRKAEKRAAQAKARAELPAKQAAQIQAQLPKYQKIVNSPQTYGYRPQYVSGRLVGYSKRVKEQNKKDTKYDEFITVSDGSIIRVERNEYSRGIPKTSKVIDFMSLTTNYSKNKNYGSQRKKQASLGKKKVSIYTKGKKDQARTVSKSELKRITKPKKKMTRKPKKTNKIGVNPSKNGKLKKVGESFKIGKNTRNYLVSNKRTRKERLDKIYKIAKAFANGNLGVKNLQAAGIQAKKAYKLKKALELRALENAIKARTGDLKGKTKEEREKLMLDFFTNSPSAKAIREARPIIIRGQRYIPYTEAERKFFLNIKATTERSDKMRKDFEFAVRQAGMKVNDYDSMYTKALKGLGQLGIGTLASGAFIANAVDNAITTGKPIFSKTNIKNAMGKAFIRSAGVKTTGNIFKPSKKDLSPEFTNYAIRELKNKRKVAAKGVIESFRPDKPENWANILFVVVGVMAAPKGGILKSILRGEKNFRPSIRNLSIMEKALKKRLSLLAKAEKLAKSSIKDGFKVSLNKRLLNKFSTLEKQIQKSLKTISKIKNDPQTLKLTDMNPLIKTSRLIKNIGKERQLFHATGAKASDIFGNKFSELKPFDKISKAVKKASGKPKRLLSQKTAAEKAFLKKAAAKGWVITGGRAQNVFVKSLLKRTSLDFDVFAKNPKTAASQALSYLRKQLPKDTFTLTPFKSKGGFVVYRILKNGKNFIDFDPISRAKGLKPIKVGKNLVANPEFLAKRKASTIFDPRKAPRVAKDKGDLRRLVGSFFRDNKFLKKLKDPKNMFTVRPQPSGMGAGRIAFSETQMFFDLEVPTGYAYNSFVKNVIPKSIISLAKKVGFKEAFIKKLNSLKYYKSNAKVTVLEVKIKISKFPKQIAARIAKAKKGQLTTKQSIQLRKDINAYIKKNPNKAFVGSRTGSLPKGEREVVFSAKEGQPFSQGTQFVKGKRSISIDPATNQLIQVFELVTKKQKQMPKTLKQILRAKIKQFKKDPFAVFRRKFQPEDAARVRKWQKQLKRADKLTDKDYVDFLYITEKMLKSKTAKKALKSTRNAAKKSLSKRRPTPTTRKGVKPGKPVQARKTSKKQKEKIKRRNIAKIKRRQQTRATQKRRITKTVRRTKTRITKRRRPRTTARKSRTLTRPRPRQPVRERIRQPVRQRPRQRVRDRPRQRSRLTTRQRTIFRGYRNTLTRKVKRIVAKYKGIRKKDKEELKRWIKGLPQIYQPSLNAILFNIIGKKPKNITGLETRPILMKKRKTTTKRKKRVMRRKKKK